MKIKDLARESWSISWPMTVIMFFEFLIGLTDVYIAGKFSKEVQAAYGLSFQIYFIFIMLAIALSVGSVSIISRLFTSDRKNELGAAVCSSIIMSAAAGFIFSLLGVIFSGSLINALRIPHEIKIFAIPFVGIFSLAFLFDYILICANSVLRACNMIKKSLWTMTIVCVLNVTLNFALAFGTPLGFRGIAVATVISIFVGSVIGLSYVRGLMARGFGTSFEVIKKILNVSWPAGILQLLWQSGAMVLFLILSCLPKNNIEIMAAFTNGLRIEAAIFLPAFAFNMANAVVVGNSLGKGEEENAFRAGMTTAFIGVAIVTILTMAVMVNARSITSLLSGNSIVVEESVRYISIALLLEPVMAWGVILGGGLNGAGDTRMVMLAVALSVWLVRVPLSYFLGVYLGFGAAAVWWSMNLSVLAQCIFISRRYFSRKWTRIA